MANTPKAKAPSEVALSAVEEALEADFGATPEPNSSSEQESTTADTPQMSATPAKEAGTTAPSSDKKLAQLVEENQASRQVRRNGRGGRPPTASNDDRQSIGSLMFALQRKPSAAPFWFAFAVSVVWASLGLAMSWDTFAAQLEQSASFSGVFENPTLVLISVFIVVPIAFVWVMALMFWRAQEMRNVARGMTEVALRLAEPEDVAKESILNVGQAIRREAAAMGDGIERAIARASELEVLIHKEVSSLENSYNDNELKIRRLVEELVSQREAIQANAELVRETISGSHENLASQLANTSEEFASSVDRARERLTGSIDSVLEQMTSRLEGRVSEVTDSFTEAGSNMVSSLTIRSDDYVERLTSTGSELVETLSETGSKLSETLHERGASINEEFSSTASSFINNLTERGTDLNTRLSETSEALVDNLASRSQEITATLSSTGTEIVDGLSARGNEISDLLAQRGEALQTTLGAAGAELSATITDQTEAMKGVLQAQVPS